MKQFLPLPEQIFTIPLPENKILTPLPKSLTSHMCGGGRDVIVMLGELKTLLRSLDRTHLPAVVKLHAHIPNN